jgi:hypothetical protein
MYFLIGIDDTGNSSSENTGELAQRLGERIEERRAAGLISITRHQLFQHPDIPATSHNQCACLLVDADQDARRDIELVCREFLMRECAVGSNAGFALSSWSAVTPAISAWGVRAKTSLLSRREAMSVARASKVSIAGFTGRGLGVIGALAAIGLYYDGNDGRFLWLPGLSDLKGILSYTELMHICPLDRVENQRGRRPHPNDLINIGESATPILREGKSLLLLASAKKGDPFEWTSLSHERIRDLSS